MHAVAAPDIAAIVSALQEGKAAEAEHMSRAWLSREPASEDGLLLLTMSLQLQGRPAEAADDCRERRCIDGHVTGVDALVFLHRVLRVSRRANSAVHSLASAAFAPAFFGASIRSAATPDTSGRVKRRQAFF